MPKTDLGEHRREVRIDPSVNRLPEIYVFCNSAAPQWYIMAALSEDGEFLSGHCCSHPAWGLHDMGLSGDWKHDKYAERYPKGFALVWIDDPKSDERVNVAHAKHMAYGVDGSPWDRERATKEKDAVPA